MTLNVINKFSKVHKSPKNWQIDFPFLIFLILAVQGNLQLKLLGLIFILLYRTKAFLTVHYLNLFYFTIILYHILYGSFNLFFETFSYLPSYLMVLFFWVFSFCALAQISFFFKINDPIKIEKTINLFFYFNIFFVVIQYILIVFEFKSINPYSVSNSAGDFIKSIYSNSSVNLIVMSFFCLMYFMKKEWKKALAATIVLIMTTYMSGLVIFLGLLLVSIYFFSKIQLKYKFLILLFGIGFLFIFKEISPTNVTYASRYITRIIKNDENTPYKIKSFWQTFDYWTSSVDSFIFGAGGGNFSSRTAFITSGDYVSWYPNSISYVSPEFGDHHFGIWKHDFRNPWDNINNTANQPFSFYNKIIGEYGLVGICLFLVFYINFFVRNGKYLTYSKFMLIVLLGYFLLDYWYEYFSIIIIFELLVFNDYYLNKGSKSKINYEMGN
ncbi:hypothetical protein [Mangrovimonas xylaniphaga]|uniref:hypothetical protein n=1 Tax=Mangrovimonas xylaniphaga TaxID=1645915 RepID=UPI0006B46CEB|nr:hypothetical protein [Mangrovimonas xylaniphaga]